MKRILKIIGSCFFIVISQNLFVATGQTEPDQVIKVDTNLVNVFFSAVDKDSLFLTSLERADVKVYEDGRQQEILTFRHEMDRPLSIALLIDISGSEKHTLTQEKIAARFFIDEAIRRTHDQVAIISFAADPFLEQSLTNNIEDAKKAMDRVQAIKGVLGYQGTGSILPISAKPAGGSLSYTSAIWDALWITCRHLISGLPINRRKVLVIVTDGEDTSSRASLQEAVDIAVRTDTVIYVIGVGDTSIAQGVNSRMLSNLAFQTGGQFFSPKKVQDLTGAFDRIARELRSQYLLTYVPQNKIAEDSYRQVRVEVSTPRSRRDKLRLFYRPSYYFKRQPGT